MDRLLSTKQFFTAVILLFVVGVGLSTVLYFYINQDIFHRLVVNYTPVTKEPSTFNLEVNSPEDETLVFDKNIVISGKTAPLSTLIIINDTDTFGFESSSKGDFSKVVTLHKGPNILSINSFDSTGNTKQITKKIYYSEEKLEDDVK